MKAPDKIYVSHLIYDTWQYTTPNPDDETEVEYIRKDALLEKLEKIAAEYKKRSDKGELVWQHMCGIKEAIDILNGM